MKNGVMVRTLEELQGNFDAEKLIGHWLNGKLQTWLSDRHYDEQYTRISAIDKSSETVINALCEALNIYFEAEKIDIQLDEIAKRQAKIKLIRQYTNDKIVMDCIENVATNQEELDDLLISKCEKIYLIGDVFRVNNDLADMELVGINNPTIEIVADCVVAFADKNVQIIDCQFNKEYCALLDEKRLEDECNSKKKHQDYCTSAQFDYLLSELDRKKSNGLFNVIQDSMISIEFDVDVVNRNIATYLYSSEVFQCFDINKLGKSVIGKMKNAGLTDAFDDFKCRNK